MVLSIERGLLFLASPVFICLAGKTLPLTKGKDAYGKMRTMKKNIAQLLAGMTVIFLGMALTGCTYSEIVTKDSLILPTDQTKSGDHERVVVYGVSFEHLNTIVRVKKFGIQHVNETTIKVSHGLSYAFETNEIGVVSAGKLKMILYRYHFDSLEQFIKQYASAESILPNSDFKALPGNIGRDLFFFAQDNNNLDDDDNPSVWPDL